MPTRTARFNGHGIEVSPEESAFDSVSIAVFAYNEQAAIRKSVLSILTAAENAFARDRIEVHVLANGCTDQTQRIVEQLEEEDPRIVFNKLAIADKSETWNQYVHSISKVDNSRRLHIFMDGDVVATANVLTAANRALTQSPQTTACSFLPVSGRKKSRQAFEQLQAQDGAVFGALYGLTTEFLCRVRSKNIRLPQGLVGDDATVTEMIAFSLDRSNQYDKQRVAIVNGTEGFICSKLSPFRISDLHLHWHRMIRYEIRAWQNQLMQDINFHQMPCDTKDLDQRILDSLEGRWIWNPIQRMARKRLKFRTSTSYSKT